jgi:hypothetical protein
MKSSQKVICIVALSLLLTGAFAQAQVTGTVTNKTTGKPAAGDVVALVDPMAGMSEVAHATTDARGHYSLVKSGTGPALLRVKHQGAEYFIGAPEGNAPGDIGVYDVAAKVDGVVIDEDVIGIVETIGGKLRVIERYSVRNASMPPRTQWSAHSFEIVLPEDAVVEGASAQRPGASSLPTTVKLDSAGSKGHYSFNFPIQPDDGEKSTLFQIEYMLPYSGKLTFHPQVTLPARTLWVMLPKSMSFTAGADSTFISAPQEGLPTYVAKNAVPGKALEFTVSGTGSIPRDEGGGQGGQQSGQEASGPGSQPGGGMAIPINTPDPLSKYKWWILSGLALLLAAAAAVMLRKPATGAAFDSGVVQAPAVGKAAVMNALKEELFALESDKIAGKISPAEYAEVKAALETVLKRAMKRSS